MKRAAILLVLSTLLSCARVEDDPAGLKVAFEDKDAGRIAVCRTSGRDLQYITPDSLLSSGPVTDSTHSTVYFLAKRRNLPDDLTAIYAVNVNGDSLRKISEVPLSVLDFQITPDASTIVFLGKYPDLMHVRAYQLRVGESGFYAVTPAEKSVFDPAMAPGGLNFVWNDGTKSDTLFVSSLQQYLTLPIFVFPYTQVSLSWPHGRAFAAVCGPERRGLCYHELQTPDGVESRKETVLIPESEGVAISQPTFHPDGQRILYVHTDLQGEGRSQLRLIDRNSLKITRIPTETTNPAHPVWVR